ncbi:IIGP1-like protein [Mya arenaria]|uniref:IIGP1-like protein n=1 Tax=Mya arenaria TaxID=6604 RepID=A0ABY7G9Y5_MYAAR|nr:IIGP1-like protein [Mya arenaria]
MASIGNMNEKYDAISEEDHNKFKTAFKEEGVGSPNFPKATYLEQIGFEKFYFFIIMTATRFTENDAWLGKMVKVRKRSVSTSEQKLTLI